MAAQSLTVALIQHACDRDTATNNARAESGIREAADSGARLVVLQELHSHRYFCQSESTAHFELAETIPGPSTEQFGSLAKELQIVIVASLFERRAAGLYHNTAVVMERDGSLAGRYRKMHIPDDPGYYEMFYFAPGDLGCTPVTTSVGCLGVMVCWDQWYPEAARLMALAGADLLIYPTAIGWDRADDDQEQQRQLDAWTTVQRGHAIANGIPVLACNRVGFEPAPHETDQGIRFWGNSFACGPQGEMLARAPTDSDHILTAELDLRRSEGVRRIWPFLRDRRIDGYADLTKRYRDD